MASRRGCCCLLHFSSLQGIWLAAFFCPSDEYKKQLCCLPKGTLSPCSGTISSLRYKLLVESTALQTLGSPPSFVVAYSFDLASAAATGICTNAVYGPFLVLSNHPPAESYCSSKYSVTGSGSHKRVKRHTFKTTTKTTSKPHSKPLPRAKQRLRPHRMEGRLQCGQASKLKAPPSSARSVPALKQLRSLR